MSLNLRVKVHPVVLFQIVDAYERRNADSHRVIGTLLGNIDKGIVEVINCFCVPHKETEDQVEAELTYAMDVHELNKRVNTGESIVGWWATGQAVTNHSAVIHEYYARECSNPVHVTLDTSLNGARMGLRAYVCAQLGVPGGKQGCMFTPIPIEVTCYEPEVFALHLCQKTVGTGGSGGSGKSGKGGGTSGAAGNSVVNPMQDLIQVAEAGERLGQLLETVLQYVDDVLANKVVANNSVGRKLLDLINSVPHMSNDQFSEMFNSNVKDLLMVISLSQLIKTQLQLNEKLTLLTSL